MIKNKFVDLPFLEKFSKSNYNVSEQQINNSIIEEITNILNCRIKLLNKFEISKSPFSYGIFDIESLNNNPEKILEFKCHCEKTIKQYEPRIQDLEIEILNFNQETANLEILIICTKKFGENFEMLFDFK